MQDYINAFLVGGAICVIGQILIDKTKLTPAKVLVAFVSKATIKEVNEQGLMGAFTGGLKGAAGGITAAIFFGYLMALIFNPKTK